MRTTTQRGIDLIKSFEGFRGSAYKPVPSEPYYTIGFGHYGKDVKSTDKITQTQAENLLRSDLKVYEAKVNIFDSQYHWTTNEFDALVSFCYNVGSITQLTQNGTRTKTQIASAMGRYVKDVSGKTLQGLIRRRKAEYDLFITPDDKKPVYSEETTLKEIVDDILANKHGIEPERVESVYSQIRRLVNARFR